MYGVGFGIWAIPVGSFVGPQILLSSFAHIAVGSAFLLAARGIRRYKLWADVLMLVCSLIAGGVGFIATIHAADSDEVDALLLWIPFTTLFACMAGLSLYATVTFRRLSGGDSPGQ